MAGRVAGICYVKVDGTQLEVKGGIEYNALKTKREVVMGLAGVAGYKESAIPFSLKITAIYTKDFPTNQLQNGTNMTITAELANGKVYSLSNAWVEGEMMVNGEEGTVEIEFVGVTGREQ
jgi:hypothetical protein